jgi:DNA-binding response OmpR family regulator
MRRADIPLLVIDPAPWVAESIAAGLATRGFHPYVALTREAAQCVVQANAVDVLIAHGHIPGDATPFQFAFEASMACPHLAVVAVTSDAGLEHPFSPGRACVLEKPFGLAELLAAISEARKLVAAGHHTHVRS